ncbi:hypothetical protein D3C86_1377430 [compost metagenome]
MDGQGAESGEALVEVGVAPGRRFLLCPLERAVGEQMVSLATAAQMSKVDICRMVSYRPIAVAVDVC